MKDARSFLNRFSYWALGSLILFFARSLHAWNPDYSPDVLAPQRTICLKNAGAGLLKASSIAPDENCAEGEQRYIIVHGKNPKGSYALIPIQDPSPVWPKWTLLWPPGEDVGQPKFWHFTCFSSNQLQVLGVTVKRLTYVSEIVSPIQGDNCTTSFKSALKSCIQNFGGSEILEQCF